MKRRPSWRMVRVRTVAPNPRRIAATIVVLPENTRTGEQQTPVFGRLLVWGSICRKSSDGARRGSAAHLFREKTHASPPCPSAGFRRPNFPPARATAGSTHRGGAVRALLIYSWSPRTKDPQPPAAPLIYLWCAPAPSVRSMRRSAMAGSSWRGCVATARSLVRNLAEREGADRAGLQRKAGGESGQKE